MGYSIALLLACAVSPQDGPRIDWKCGDPLQAMLAARDQKRPMLLYFTSDG